MKTREFSFGEAISGDYEIPENLGSVLRDWVRSISIEGWAQDVSSKGVNARAFTHEAAVENAEQLVQRLGEVLKNLAGLESPVSNSTGHTHNKRTTRV